jgi:hypothetical protein
MSNESVLPAVNEKYTALVLLSSGIDIKSSHLCGLDVLSRSQGASTFSAQSGGKVRTSAQMDETSKRRVGKLWRDVCWL